MDLKTCSQCGCELVPDVNWGKSEISSGTLRCKACSRAYFRARMKKRREAMTEDDKTRRRRYMTEYYQALRATDVDGQRAVWRRHVAVRRKRGSASLHDCDNCCKQAAEWAWVHYTDPDDVNNYRPLCIQCHEDYDRVFRDSLRHEEVMPRASDGS